jgi:hypothetical protein
MPTPEYLPPRQIGELFGMSRTTVFKMIKLHETSRGRLGFPSYSMSTRKRLLKVDDVRKAMARFKQ